MVDLGLVVGELTLEDDATRFKLNSHIIRWLGYLISCSLFFLGVVFCSVSDDDVSLEGLEQELQDYKTDDVCFYQFYAFCLLMICIICPKLFMRFVRFFFCLPLKVVTMILSKGTTSRNYTKDVEHNLRRIELDSIQVLVGMIS